ncbi:uncharacterized protein LOC130903895 [Diorhabda carinulata]|uniref:uncharacterized protein LOC130903895 n=1 Tax=Diorhabda carinulata TaxID=1163345 RepID=UPI0025A057CA|nr:uncharacterized protein LOC130903895 [Diorhabda carinulata]XP_057672244.1 uncharacterized protein LOC130903895 [Diorhabda carinulata]XP_057672245.1 uncharacterized protein LOC130903895 [Diorhabda carinulata]
MESDDEADLKKIEDIIKVSQEDNFTHLEFQEYINLSDSEEDEEFEIPDSIDNEVENEDLDKSNKIDISTIYKYSPNASLKSEEKAIIDSCEDQELKHLLVLNRQKNLQLIQLYKKYKDLLIECKQNIVDKNDLISQYFEAHKAQSQSSGSWRVGAPYFKTKDFFVAPSNDDVLRKKSNNELSHYDLQLPKRWNKFDLLRLITSVKVNYNCNQILEVKKNIKQLSSSDDLEKENKIHDLEMRLKELDDMDNLEVPPLGSDNNINWIRVSETFIKDRYSDFECRSCWNLIAHPAINNSKWTAKESKQLLSLVQKYRAQNWIKIAKELGTNRSCLNVCQYYFREFHDGFKKGEFTVGEDRKLLQLVDRYKMGTIIPWTKISRHFKNRSRSQLHHRYLYYLNQSDKKRGKFSDAEDVIILLCVKKFGNQYSRCAEFLPERSAPQIKTRYTSSLRSVVKRGTWTVEEDRQLHDFVEKYGPMWTQLSRQEGVCRAAGQLRQRYLTICEYLKSHPHATIEDVPRRKHNLDYDVLDRFHLIEEAIKRFVDSPLIPSLREVEDMLEDIKQVHFVKVEMHDDDFFEERKPFTDIDSLLTDFFWNNSDEEVSVVPPSVLKSIVEETEILLDVLKVNLDIPEDLNKNLMLDSLDKDILNELRKNRTLHHTSKITKIVPPNFFTTTGIRSLLLKNYKFVNSPKDRIFCAMDIPQSIKSRISNEIYRELNEMDKSSKHEIEQSRKLFYRRFLSLFKFPGVLTIEEPSRELLSISENFQNEFKPLVKRTYSRMKNNELTKINCNDIPKKIRVLDGSAKESLKLTPVKDKSIIMNLMKDTNKKLFRMNKVQCGDQTKTLIEEVDVRNLQSTSTLSVSTVVKPKKQKKEILCLSKRGKKILNPELYINYQSLSPVQNSQKLKGESHNSDDINVSKAALMDESDIFDAGDDDLMDLQKLSAFIRTQKQESE